MKIKFISFFKALLALALIMAMTSAVISCDELFPSPEQPPDDEASYPTLSWRSDGLFAQLPPPTTEYGSVLINTEDTVKVEFNGVSRTDYTLYVQLCSEHGYTTDVKSSDFFYSAKNAKGYRVTLQYTEGKKLITLSLDGSEMQKTVDVGSDAFNGMPFEEAVETLKAFGFNNVTVRAVATPSGESHADGTVESVTVNASSFDAGESFPRSTEIVVRYYKQSVITEFASSALIGKPVAEVEKLLRDAGFANVTVKAVKTEADDAKIGAVISIAVNGRTSFEVGTELSPNAAVYVTYYSADNALAQASVNAEIE